MFVTAWSLVGPVALPPRPEICPFQKASRSKMKGVETEANKLDKVAFPSSARLQPVTVIACATWVEQSCWTSLHLKYSKSSHKN